MSSVSKKAAIIFNKFAVIKLCSYKNTFLTLSDIEIDFISEVQHHHSDVPGPVQHTRHRHRLAQLRPPRQLLRRHPSLPHRQGGIQQVIKLL